MKGQVTFFELRHQLVGELGHRRWQEDGRLQSGNVAGRRGVQQDKFKGRRQVARRRRLHAGDQVLGVGHHEVGRARVRALVNTVVVQEERAVLVVHVQLVVATGIATAAAALDVDVDEGNEDALGASDRSKDPFLAEALGRLLEDGRFARKEHSRGYGTLCMTG